MMTYPKPLDREEEQLVMEQLAKGCKHAERKIVEHNMRLVQFLSNKFKSAVNDTEDMVSIGSVGLLKAARTFDPCKGIKFATYASRCIKNEILMHLRKEQKAIRNVSLDEPIRKDEEGNQLIVSDLIGSGRYEVEEMIEDSEDLAIIGQILNTLPQEEGAVIRYRYGIGTERKRQTEIAELMNISQSYVSRIERKALRKIKKTYEHRCAVAIG